MIHFECPNCGKKMRIDDRFAGRRAKCPACATAVAIPEPEPAPELAPEPESVPSPSAGRPGQESREGLHEDHGFSPPGGAAAGAGAFAGAFADDAHHESGHESGQESDGNGVHGHGNDQASGLRSAFAAAAQSPFETEPGGHAGGQAGGPAGGHAAAPGSSPGVGGWEDEFPPPDDGLAPEAGPGEEAEQEAGGQGGWRPEGMVELPAGEHGLPDLGELPEASGEGLHELPPEGLPELPPEGLPELPPEFAATGGRPPDLGGLAHEEHWQPHETDAHELQAHEPADLSGHELTEEASHEPLHDLSGEFSDDLSTELSPEPHAGHADHGGHADQPPDFGAEHLEAFPGGETDLADHAARAELLSEPAGGRRGAPPRMPGAPAPGGPPMPGAATGAPQPATGKGGKGGKGLLIGLLALLVVGGGGFAVWKFVLNKPEDKPGPQANANTGKTPGGGTSGGATGDPATGPSTPGTETPPATAPPPMTPDGKYAAGAGVSGQIVKTLAFNDQPQAISPDGQRVAVLKLGGGQAIMSVVGPDPAAPPVTHPAFENIRQGLAVFSPDSQRLAYPASNGPGKAVAVIDGTPGKEYQGIAMGTFAFSADSAHVAYGATTADSKSVIVVDGMETPMQWDYVIPNGVALSADGKRVAYAGGWSRTKPARYQVVVDGQPWKATFGQIGTGIPGRGLMGLPRQGLTFSPDGSKLVAVVGYADASGIVTKWSVAVDGTPGPGYDEIFRGTPIFSPDSSRLVYVARTGTNVDVIDNGKPVARWSGVGEITFSPDGKRLAYQAYYPVQRPAGAPATAPAAPAAGPPQRGVAALIVDGKPVARAVASQLTFAADGNRIAYVNVTPAPAAATPQGTPPAAAVSVVTIDLTQPTPAPKAGKTYTGQISQLTWSPDGVHYAYLVTGPDQLLLVVDGVEMPYNFEGEVQKLEFVTGRPHTLNALVLALNGLRHVELRIGSAPTTAPVDTPTGG